MRTARTVVVFCAFILLALRNSAELAAQQPGTSTLPTKSIKINLIVADEKGKSVDDIKVQDLELKVDGELQKISYLERVEKPVIYAVAIDTSESFRPLMLSALLASKILVENNRPYDETMLVRFVSSDKISHVVPFTTDKTALLNVPIDKFSPLPGQTAVLDALHVSVEETVKRKATDLEARRAVVLISDGEDRASFYDLSKVKDLLRERNVQVFIIGIIAKLDRDRGLIRVSSREKAERLLSEIAKESGGRVFFPTNEEEVLEAAKHITRDLQSQYVMGFERSVPSNKKGFEKFEIRMAGTSTRTKLKIMTRPGYWLTPPEPKTKK
jgi:Ca-activated chloride channel homolog